jgi:flagellar hook-associated protein 1 FlgK
VDEINAITTRIAEINGAMATAKANGSEHALEDQQANLVRRLSELADVHVIAREDGGVDVTVGSGRPLVVAANVYTIGMTSTPPSGYAQLTSEGTPFTGEITGGTLGGLLQVRDTTIPGYQATLDNLAFQTAASVNGLHQAGFDLSGAAGGAFFGYSTAPAGTAGAARALRVEPAIAGDGSLIAAAGVAAAGDNGTARALAALRHERVYDGSTSTLNDGWGALVYRIGSDAREFADSRDTHDAITRQVDAMRDQVSGVSLDEEALNLMKFQRAYEANARFFSVVDDMLVTLLNLR